MGAKAAEDLLTLARRVVEVEASGVSALAQTLGEAFLAALEVLQGCQGRVIFSGMGKSGHIGAKLAATMASTGTPAFFVHPGEASHGDLGMIEPKDVLVLLSNSGNTDELRDMVAYGRRHQLPIIGISRARDSLVGEAADVFLQLPQVPEACALRLAPTTSTTMTLALGDALCVCLMQVKGFQPADFHRFHPGGKLGLDLLTVQELQRRPEQVPTCAVTAPMAEVIEGMNAGGIGLIVLNVGAQVVGLITDGDIRRHSHLPLIQQSPEDLMSRDPIWVYPTDLAAQALKTMNDRGVTALLVRDQAGQFAGLIHIHELLRAGLG